MFFGPLLNIVKGGFTHIMEPDEMFYKTDCDAILYYGYDPVDNIFYDQDRLYVANIFEVLTPNDVRLFKEDYGYCIFHHRNNPRIWCEIFIEYE